jgi:hypothetical protein
MKNLYRTEIWDKDSNDFVVLKRCRNEENAIIAADVYNKSRQLATRVIYNGNIIYSKEAPKKYTILDQLKEIVGMK